MLLMSISSVSYYLEVKNDVPILNTAFWWFIHFLFLSMIFFLRGKLLRGDFFDFIYVKIYLYWNVICIFRGLFVAENYWDWKGLVNNGMALIIPIFVFCAADEKGVSLLFRSYFKYVLPTFVFIYFLIDPDAYGFYLVPVSFILLFFPVLPLRWKAISIILAATVVFSDLGARSNAVKFIFPLLFSFLYYFRLILFKYFYEAVRLIFFVVPCVTFMLAVSVGFNIFKLGDYYDLNLNAKSVNSYSVSSEENLAVDTRTFLYEDVLNTARIYDSWLIGRSPARGNLSEAFGMNDEAGRGERLVNEVSILNIFTWTGIVGVIFHFLVFYRATYLAVNKSKNIFIKILGIFIAFRWAWSWVEDVNNFTITQIFLWIMLGICCSGYFRRMSDFEFRRWLIGLIK